MTTLRWYDIGPLEQSALLLRQRLESGAVGWMEFAVSASRYTLRDESGAYWFLDAAAGGWLRCDSEGWRPAAPAQGRLEGLQALADSALLPTALLDGFEDPFSGKEAWQPTEVMQILVQKAGQDYRAGRSSSTDVELLLGRLFLVDRQGRFWTTGILSQKWYRYADQGWVQVGHSPDPQQLVRWQGGRAHCSQCGTEVVDVYVCPNCGNLLIPGIDHLDQAALLRVYRFLLLGAGTLPEPVAAPWEPPGEFPPQADGGARCEVCGASSLPGSRFCSRCGARLGCPNCGAANPPGSRFCNNCGQSLA